MRIVAVIFEGGKADRPVTQAMASLRHRVVLDIVEKLFQTGEYDEIVVDTNYPELRAMLRDYPVTLREEIGTFHFGRALQQIVIDTNADGVLCMGGASAPFMSTDEFKDMASGLRCGTNLFYTNNPQSSDVVAFTPARAVLGIEPPDRDNALGTALKDEAGLKRVLLPHSIGVHFDLDTPADVLIMSLSSHTGPHTRQYLGQLGWDTDVLRRAIDAMAQTNCELGLIGRVNPAVMTHINSHTFCRLRVFSEERGMKALRREEEGLVVSLLGHFIARLGVDEFFACLAQTCDVAFIDTRILFAHFKLALTEEERFTSDLGLWQQLEEPFLREFTRAASAASIPVVLGGHSLVTGGMWAIIDILREMRTKHR
ncbi:MAG TPA: hypothetical protein VK905_03710 [Bacillota bacterium]|nr:hypothetical protein [Bacillota bacterium]